MSLPYDLLLLDFGGVCLLNPVELHHVAEQKLGLPANSIDWLGPIDPSTDGLWREMTTGESLREREYWAQRAAEVGAATGRTLSLREYMTLLYSPPTPELIRPDATSTVERARCAGYAVSILTNDLRSFHGTEWEADVPFFDLIDHVIDGSDTGILKPDPLAYERAARITETAPHRILFVDDQQLSVDGADRCGIDAMWFDIADPAASWAEVATRLGL